MKTLSLIPLVFAFAISAHAAPCGPFKAVEFTPVKTDAVEVERAQIGPFSLDVGTAPAVITHVKTKKTCTSKVANIEGDDNDAFWLKGPERVLLRSNEDDNQRFTLVDAKTCKTVWESRPNLGGKVDPRAVKINATCGECEETKKFDGVCDCEAAEVWQLNESCEMEYDEAASRVLTRSQLKVAFAGKKKIKAAKSPGAQIQD